MSILDLPAGLTRCGGNSEPVTEMILVQNWFEELKRLCPTGK
jgi:hypothetical protein